MYTSRVLSLGLQLHLLASLALAQLCSDEGNSNCTLSFLNANASGSAGFYSCLWNNTDLIGNCSANVTWTYTVNTLDLAETANNEVEAGFWLSTPPGLNYEDGSNSFSACAIIFDGLSIDALEMGQADDGYCQDTLSKECIYDLTTKAELNAGWLVNNPTFGPFSNLTPPILGPICNQIAVALNDLWSPDSSLERCRPYFNISGYEVSGIQITSNQSDIGVAKAYTGNNYTNFLPGTYNWTSSVAETTDLYDTLVRRVSPILTVFMSPANVSREYEIGQPIAHMNCLRTTNFTTGSRISPQLPAGTPISTGTGLTKGAIASIVIGALVGVGLIVAGVVVVIIRRRRTTRALQEQTLQPKKLDSHSQQQDELGGTAINEAAGENAAKEMPVNEPVVAELDGDEPISPLLR